MLKPIQVTEVRCYPARSSTDTLMYFVSFVINGNFFIGNVAVRLRADGRGIRLVFPTKTLPNGVVLSCAHPIRKEANEAITKAVEIRLKELAEKCGEPFVGYRKSLENQELHQDPE